MYTLKITLTTDTEDSCWILGKCLPQHRTRSISEHSTCTYGNTHQHMYASPSVKYCANHVFSVFRRRFVPKELLLNFLDAMSYLKMNVFHWHLSDFCIFSIESKVYVCSVYVVQVARLCVMYGRHLRGMGSASSLHQLQLVFIPYRLVYNLLLYFKVHAESFTSWVLCIRTKYWHAVSRMYVSLCVYLHT